MYFIYNLTFNTNYDLEINPNNITLTLLPSYYTIVNYFSLIVVVIDKSPAVPVPVLINYY